MKIVAVIAEWLYLTDANGVSAIPFSEQNSNVKDFYAQAARKAIPQLISSYLSQRAWLGKIVRGSIVDAAQAHNLSLTSGEVNSIAKRVVRNIAASIAKKEE